MRTSVLMPVRRGRKRGHAAAVQVSCAQYSAEVKALALLRPLRSPCAWRAARFASSRLPPRFVLILYLDRA